GEGTIIQDPCKTCNGRALQRRERTIEVRVPAGVETGMRLRLTGQGHAHATGPRGDAYAVVQVTLPDHIERRGSNAVARITVPAPMAVLGHEAQLDGLDETLELEIPAGTQPGQVLRLRGKGFPTVGGSRRGDLYVEVNVELPEKPGKEAREHWEALLELDGGEVKKGVLEKLGDKARDIFS
ncbi:MAG: DnaJ C-terminal domain-containing protein, partial [Candidatus Thermoplasmatota archaeon]|nr:DnaJ C-terminal domain-containing protein [Candidatus Thermoplasmatota archaeon]